MPAWPLPFGAPSIYPGTPAGVAPPTISDWQFNYNGVTFGAGTDIGVTKIVGMGALPTVNSADQAYPRDTGEYVGVDAMGGRDPAIDLVITSNIYSQMVTIGGALAAGGIQEQPLWFQLPGLPMMCSPVRPRTRTSDWDTNVSAGGMWTPSLGFHATDPRLYAAAEITPSPSSGTGSVTFTVMNDGNTETRPVIVLTGPLIAPTITNTTFGASASTTFALDVASGDQIVIDYSIPHTVIYWTGGIGGSPVFQVYNWLDQAHTQWWELLPGANSLTCTATASSFTVDQFAVWSASAYML